MYAHRAIGNKKPAVIKTVRNFSYSPKITIETRDSKVLVGEKKVGINFSRQKF